MFFTRMLMAILLSFGTSVVSATELGLVDTVYGKHRAIEMTGQIESGDTAKLQATLKGIERADFEDTNTLLSMDSPGGSFPAALELADFIREAQMATHIGPD